MMRLILVVALVAAASTALPAQADDGDASRDACLRSELDAALKANARLKREIADLRVAYNQFAIDESKRLRGVTSAAASFQAARVLIKVSSIEAALDALCDRVK